MTQEIKEQFIKYLLDIENDRLKYANSELALGQAQMAKQVREYFIYLNAPAIAAELNSSSGAFVRKQHEDFFKNYKP